MRTGGRVAGFKTEKRRRGRIHYSPEPNMERTVASMQDKSRKAKKRTGSRASALVLPPPLPVGVELFHLRVVD